MALTALSVIYFSCPSHVFVAMSLIAFVSSKSVATESGILHEMKRLCPDKTFIPAPPDDAMCACNECAFMKMNTLQKVYDCLDKETPEITIDPHLQALALKPIRRMLDITAKLSI